jgi:XapX domain-containing protein
VKVYLISMATGLSVGVVFDLLQLWSPAPPLVDKFTQEKRVPT